MYTVRVPAGYVQERPELLAYAVGYSRGSGSTYSKVPSEVQQSGTYILKVSDLSVFDNDIVVSGSAKNIYEVKAYSTSVPPSGAITYQEIVRKVPRISSEERRTYSREALQRYQERQRAQYEARIAAINENIKRAKVDYVYIIVEDQAYKVPASSWEYYFSKLKTDMAYIAIVGKEFQHYTPDVTALVTPQAQQRSEAAAQTDIRGNQISLTFSTGRGIAVPFARDTAIEKVEEMWQAGHLTSIEYREAINTLQNEKLWSEVQSYTSVKQQIAATIQKIKEAIVGEGGQDATFYTVSGDTATYFSGEEYMIGQLAKQTLSGVQPDLRVSYTLTELTPQPQPAPTAVEPELIQPTVDLDEEFRQKIATVQEEVKAQGGTITGYYIEDQSACFLFKTEEELLAALKAKGSTDLTFNVLYTVKSQEAAQQPLISFFGAGTTVTVTPKQSNIFAVGSELSAEKRAELAEPIANLETLAKNIISVSSWENVAKISDVRAPIKYDWEHTQYTFVEYSDKEKAEEEWKKIREVVTRKDLGEYAVSVAIGAGIGAVGAGLIATGFGAPVGAAVVAGAAGGAASTVASTEVTRHVYIETGDIGTAKTAGFVAGIATGALTSYGVSKVLSSAAASAPKTVTIDRMQTTYFIGDDTTTFVTEPTAFSVKYKNPTMQALFGTKGIVSIEGEIVEVTTTQKYQLATLIDTLDDTLIFQTPKGVATIPKRFAQYIGYDVAKQQFSQPVLQASYNTTVKTGLVSRTYEEGIFSVPLVSPATFTIEDISAAAATIADKTVLPFTGTQSGIATYGYTATFYSKPIQGLLGGIEKQSVLIAGVDGANVRIGKELGLVLVVHQDTSFFTLVPGSKSFTTLNSYSLGQDTSFFTLVPGASTSAVTSPTSLQATTPSTGHRLLSSGLVTVTSPTSLQATTALAGVAKEVTVAGLQALPITSSIFSAAPAAVATSSVASEAVQLDVGVEKVQVTTKTVERSVSLPVSISVQPAKVEYSVSAEIKPTKTTVTKPVVITPSKPITTQPEISVGVSKLITNEATKEIQTIESATHREITLPVVYLPEISVSVSKPITKEATKEIQALKSATYAEEITKSKSLTEEITTQAETETTVTRQAEIVVTLTKQAQLTSTKEPIFISPVTVPVFFGATDAFDIPKLNKKDMPSIDLLKKGKKLLKVYVKRRKKWMPVGIASTLKEAIAKGKHITETSLAASFLVQGAEEKVKLEDKKYYVKKSPLGLHFVQKRQYRLSTRGEKKEIIFAKKLKKRRNFDVSY